MSASPSRSLVVRGLYRSLLRAAKPFTPPSPNATIMTCLLHRSGFGDESWEDFIRGRRQSIDEKPRDQVKEENLHMKLFRSLLREVVSGGDSSGQRQMILPEDARGSNTLKAVICREFRDGNGSVSSTVSFAVRQKVAFLALRELNKKLSWSERLEARAPPLIANQAARLVSPLPRFPPQSYLRPGAYLIAHPHQTGYFHRTVICILDHQEESNSTDTKSYGTYGLIINRVSQSTQSGNSMTLEEILRPLPNDLSMAFSSSIVKEGGPVHMSLQMTYSANEDKRNLKIGGVLLSPIVSEDESAAYETDQAIYYKGDIINAANSVMSGDLDRDDVSFFVGASCWSVGQLESEIERGCWLPCRGPTEIAHRGTCDHDPVESGQPRPKSDLWLSMMSACGEDEAKFARLLWKDDGYDELGRPCDEL